MAAKPQAAMSVPAELGVSVPLSTPVKLVIPVNPGVSVRLGRCINKTGLFDKRTALFYLLMNEYQEIACEGNLLALVTACLDWKKIRNYSFLLRKRSYYIEQAIRKYCQSGYLLHG